MALFGAAKYSLRGLVSGALKPTCALWVLGLLALLQPGEACC